MDSHFNRQPSARRRTKIVATLGPATETTTAIDRLIGLGVNCFRLNFSHGEHAWHEQLIGRVRESGERLGVAVAILQDISGPKIRVDPMAPLLLQHDDELMIFRDGVPAGAVGISINYPQVLDAIRVGDQIFFADGSIRTEAVRVGAAGVAVRVLQGGPLSSRKGVNLPVRGLDLSALTAKDREDLRFGVRHGVDLVAVSFVRSAEDLLQARRVIVEAGGDTPIFAKIEKEEALENLEEIIKVADGILVARGDLGVEIGVHRVPVVQKEILRRVSHKGLPVIVATQMLTSMVSSPYPTRAEVSDVANAVLDGADAVMLSEETTVGKYPGEAVAMLDLTIRETECCYPWYREFHEVGGPRRAFAAAAVTLQRTTGASGIVSFTESGLIALMVARQRPQTRMLAATSNPRTLRRLAVVWGVEPVWMPVSYVNSDEAVYHFFRENGGLVKIDAEHFYIATIGRNSDRSGSTNLMLLVDAPCLAQLAVAHG
ncbi:MAG: pyruvate kinase [Desulfobulbaceae bacterium]|nr:pyruvate kinase [Desulfobulbaceae bacterium]